MLNKYSDFDVVPAKRFRQIKLQFVAQMRTC